MRYFIKHPEHAAQLRVLLSSERVLRGHCPLKGDLFY